MTNRILPRTDVIVSGSEAKRRGLMRYFTGQPCKYGHVDERRTSNGQCCECIRIRHRAVYDADPTKRAARTKKLRAADPERYLSYSRKWLANPDNAAALRLSSAAWAKANPERNRAARAQRRAHNRGAEGKFTAADVAQIREWQAGNCAACQRDLNVTGYSIDHIIPLAKGGTHWPHNIHLLCPTCNSSKCDRNYEEWIAERRRLGAIP